MRKKIIIVLSVSLVCVVLIVVWMWVSVQNTVTITKDTTLTGQEPLSDEVVQAPPTMAETSVSHETEMAPPLEDDSLLSIDRVLEKMEFGNIAFNAPKTMNIKDSTHIHLIISVEKTIEDIKKMIVEEGEKVDASIRVLNRMEARLSGRNFAITSINPEVQAVARREVSEWKWEIKPKAVGEQSLHLTISALLSIDGESIPRVIRTFDRIINVKITTGQQAIAFIRDNWMWLWTTAFVPIFGYIWKIKKRSVKQKKRGRVRVNVLRRKDV